MADAAQGSASKTPADFLRSIKGKPVVVKLNSGVDYRGDLHSLLSICMQYGAEHHHCRVLCARPDAERARPPLVSRRVDDTVGRSQVFWRAWTAT